MLVSKLILLLNIILSAGIDGLRFDLAQIESHIASKTRELNELCTKADRLTPDEVKTKKDEYQGKISNTRSEIVRLTSQRDELNTRIREKK